MGFDERHVLPSLRLMPYHRLKCLEPGLRTIRVDPFDLTDALESIRGTIRRATGDGPVRISASGGTKILTNAAILAAFQEGIEAWYCDPDPVRLPVLRGVSLAAAFSSAEGAIAHALHGPIGYDHLAAAVADRGFARRTVLGAIRSLAAKGLVELDRDDGTVVVRPSPRFALFRDHLRAVPKKG